MTTDLATALGNKLAAKLAAINKSMSDAVLLMSGGHTDEQYAERMIREHRRAVARQPVYSRPATAQLPTLPYLPPLAAGGRVSGTTQLPPPACASTERTQAILREFTQAADAISWHGPRGAL